MLVQKCNWSKNGCVWHKQQKKRTVLECCSDFQRQLQSIIECLYIPDVPSSHLRIFCAHAHFPAAPVARHTSQQTPHLMKPVKRAKRILHLSAKFSETNFTAGALQTKVTAQVRRLITPGTSQYTRGWTNLECPLSDSKCSPGIKHTNNLNGLQKQFIRRSSRDYRKRNVLTAWRDSDMQRLLPFSVNEQSASVTFTLVLSSSL